MFLNSCLELLHSTLYKRIMAHASKKMFHSSSNSIFPPLVNQYCYYSDYISDDIWHENPSYFNFKGSLPKNVKSEKGFQKNDLQSAIFQRYTVLFKIQDSNRKEVHYWKIYCSLTFNENPQGFDGTLLYNYSTHLV